MDVSKRIEFIVDSLDKVGCLADIGTDHGYVPLLALEREKADKVIACDINKDPLDKAKLNAILEGIFAFIIPVITSTEGLCVAIIKCIPAALAICASLHI